MVTFGAAAGKVTSDTATKIVVTTPAGTPGLVNVTVTTAGGSATLPDAFTYAAAPAVSSIKPASGPLGSGTVIEIGGANLSEATAVKFGTVLATSFTVVSGTEITATDPAGKAGAVDVTVTTAGGTSKTSAADKFTYVAAPAITKIAPAAGPLGGGTAVTITGKNLTNATAVTFTMGLTVEPAMSFVVKSATTIVATSPAMGAGLANVTVTTAGGTSPVVAADQFTYVAAPSITSILPTAGSLAGGTLVTIDGSNLLNATVKFGTTAVTKLTSDNGATITVKSPAGKAARST